MVGAVLELLAPALDERGVDRVGVRSARVDVPQRSTVTLASVVQTPEFALFWSWPQEEVPKAPIAQTLEYFGIRTFGVLDQDLRACTAL